VVNVTAFGQYASSIVLCKASRCGFMTYGDKASGWGWVGPAAPAPADDDFETKLKNLKGRSSGAGSKAAKRIAKQEGEYIYRARGLRSSSVGC
jgi:hypothetical protein